MDVTIEEFVVSDGAAGPYGVAAGPDGAIWFTLAGAGQIGRFAPATDVEIFDLPNPEGQPTAIIATPEGALWFTQTRDNSVGRITPTGEVTIFGLPAAGGVAGWPGCGPRRRGLAHGDDR